jgi:hypothetical protein
MWIRVSCSKLCIEVATGASELAVSKKNGGHGAGGCRGGVDLLRRLLQSLSHQGAGDLIVGRERGGAGAVGHGEVRAAAGREGAARRGGIPAAGRAAGLGARPCWGAWLGARAAVRGGRRHEPRDAAQEVGPLRLHRVVDWPVLHQDERPLPGRRRRRRGQGRQAPRRLRRRPQVFLFNSEKRRGRSTGFVLVRVCSVTKLALLLGFKQVVDRGEDAPRRRVQEPGVARRRVQQVRGRRLRRRGGGEQAAVRHHRGRVLHLPPGPVAARGGQVIRGGKDAVGGFTTPFVDLVCLLNSDRLHRLRKEII